MKLINHLSPSAVKTRMTATNKQEAIAELLDLLVNSGAISDRATAMNDLMARESRMSTGMEQGLAIPHAKSKAVGELTVALGLAPEGIDFQSLDGKPSRVIFLVLSAVGSRGPHIECLAEIARAYSREGFREALLACRFADEVIAVLTGGVRSYARG